jgi:hypothetical protein
MLMALIKGQLSREQENMEDILTSNVFGTLQYLPPSQGVLPFITQATYNKIFYPLKNINKAIEVSYEFWPYLNELGCNPCEPDVLIRLTTLHGEKYIVLIEAKYLSGKSSERDEETHPNDQLAREYDNLRLVAEREERIPILIYLTADLSIPEEDISISKEEIIKKRNIDPDIFWLSWRHLSPVIEKINEPILQHLTQAMLKLNLVFFHGFSPIDSTIPVSWCFTRNFDWEMDEVSEFERRFAS